MSNLRKIYTFLLVLVLAMIGFTSCSQDETMDDLMDNTEITSPSIVDGNNSDKPKLQ